MCHLCYAASPPGNPVSLLESKEANGGGGRKGNSQHLKRERERGTEWSSYGHKCDIETSSSYYYNPFSFPYFDPWGTEGEGKQKEERGTFVR